MHECGGLELPVAAHHAKLPDPARPVPLITTEKWWNKIWKTGLAGRIPPKVSVRYQGEYSLFQRGRWEKLVIVGNW